MRSGDWKPTKAWAYQSLVIFAFVFLGILSLLNEVLDLPHLIVGGPATPINWAEAAIEIAYISIVGLVTTRTLHLLESKRKRAEQHIEHLNSVLRSIRNINQLIVTEKDRDTLLQKACDTLAVTRGYDAAWLGFLEDGDTFATVVGSGFGDQVPRFCEQLMSGEYPPCIANALAQGDPFVLVDKLRECGDCAFEGAHAGGEAAIIRVEHVGRFFGLFAVSFAADVTVDEEERSFLREVAGDIGLALHAMENEAARRLAKETLRDSEESLSQIVQETAVATFVIDDEHIVTHWNRACETLTGIPADEMVGTQEPWRAFYAAERPVMADLVVGGVSEKEIASYYGAGYAGSALVRGAYEAERFFPDMAQGGRWLFFNAAPLRDTRGNVVGAIETLQDVTERKQAEEALESSEERLKVIFEAAPDAIFLSDLKGTCLEGNKAAEDMIGYKREELIGRSFLNLKLLSAKELPNAAKALAKSVLGRRTGPDEFLLNRKDGSQTPVEISTYPAKIKDKTIILGIARDITERKRAEEKLQERMNELETFYRATLGREGRVIELKQEVNELLVQVGKNKKYRETSK